MSDHFFISVAYMFLSNGTIKESPVKIFRAMVILILLVCYSNRFQTSYVAVYSSFWVLIYDSSLDRE
jgi:hypothetical protein